MTFSPVAITLILFIAGLGLLSGAHVVHCGVRLARSRAKI